MSTMEPLETLDITSDVPLKVIRLDSRHIRIIGPTILFELNPAAMAEALSFGRGDSEAAEKKKMLNTKNREIVIQGENACKLSETEWLIVHRLNESEDRRMSIDELCDSEQGEAVWPINNVPTEKSRGNYANSISSKLLEGGIMAKIRHEENTYFLDI